MLSKPLIALAALTSPLVQGASLGHDPRFVIPRFSVHIGDRTRLLNDDVVQKGSTLTGMEESSKPEEGQSASQTDKANFINHCSGKTLTDGQMKEGGSCNPTPMGDIPSIENMISTVITYPLPGDTVPANKDFTISIQTHNLATGHFTNPLVTYYSAPQSLDESGKVRGHSHLVIQELDYLRTTTPPAPTEFVFFAGVNDKSEDGVLSAKVEGGLPAGAYRLCTLVAAANHQPVLMPVAQRGSQDDCVRFEVADGMYKRQEDVWDGGVGLCECPMGDVAPENPGSPVGDVAPETPNNGEDSRDGGVNGEDQSREGGVPAGDVAPEAPQSPEPGDVAPEAPDNGEDQSRDGGIPGDNATGDMADLVDEVNPNDGAVPEAPTGVDGELGGNAGVDQELGGSDGADQALGGNSDVDQELGGNAGVDQELGGSDGAVPEAPTGVDGELGGNAGVDQELGGSDSADQALGDNSDVDQELGGNAGVDQELGGSDGADQTLGGNAGVDQELGGSDGADQTLGGNAGVDQELGGSDGADQAMGGADDSVAPEAPVIDEENPVGAGGADKALGGADGASGSLEAPVDVDGVDQALGGVDDSVAPENPVSDGVAAEAAVSADQALEADGSLSAPGPVDGDLSAGANAASQELDADIAAESNVLSLSAAAHGRIAD